MRTNQIYTGDCVDILEKEIPENSINLIFADPPYNLSGNALKWKGNKTGGDWFMVNEKWDTMEAKEYVVFTEAWLAACKRTLKDNGSIYVSCTYHNIGEVLVSLKDLGFKINNIITWQKVNAMPNMTKRIFTHSTEFIVWAVKGKNWIFNYGELKKINPEKQLDGSLKQMRDVWTLPLVQGKERIRGVNGRALHPTQKPEELLRRIILASSNEGNIVLDPFLGSGTTTAVAQKLNRRWVGVEKDESYVQIATNRMKALEASLPL